MRRVILESPFAGDRRKNEDYARRCMNHSLKQGEAPFASHLLYTQEGILRDEEADERALGINAGFAWLRVAEASVVYEDLGISAGMRAGIDAAEKAGIPVEYRKILEPR